MNFFVLSYAVLWGLVLASLILNVVLFRQLGIMVMGTARGVEDSGIPVGKLLPSLELRTIDDAPWSTTALGGQPSLLFFGATYCRECREVMPLIRTLQARDDLDVVVFLFGDDGRGSAAAYAGKFALRGPVIAIDSASAKKLDVEVSPFAYVVGVRGSVVAKGLAADAQRISGMLAATGIVAELVDERPTRRRVGVRA